MSGAVDADPDAIRGADRLVLLRPCGRLVRLAEDALEGDVFSLEDSLVAEQCQHLHFCL